MVGNPSWIVELCLPTSKEPVPSKDGMTVLCRPSLGVKVKVPVCS